ncbi:P33/sulfhydryloxidase [Parapoynx stagnalis nucleopolyhedrovirus]|uniref:P33/sulfhydryloxidase n=1 Tax=Parapoynx stagnalis nucleopolyhedrovirus TaxID=2993413 RepID=A0A9E7YF73_9ABAC|nr:P33/sulfhydryloxidase [Parapoynx stagnalis nucleopolyhedrovirus]
MITRTPLFSRYEDSFLLYSFQTLNLLRSLKSSHLTKLLSSQATYLYHFACLTKYKYIQKYEVQQLIEWAVGTSPQTSPSQFHIEFIDKTNVLNLRSCQPKSSNFTFTTIWDTIHFLSLIIDDMVQTRKDNNIEIIIDQLQSMKALFYNVFLMLNCSVCRDHYMITKGVLILPIELIIKALNKEKNGLEITFVDYNYVENENIDSATIGKNILKKNLMIRTSMDYHNHINDFKWIQQNTKPPTHYKPMLWEEYKMQLSI